MKKKYLYIAIVVQLILAAILGGKLFSMDILPLLYKIAYIVIILLFNAVVFFAAKKRKTRLPMLILSILVSIVLVIGFWAVSKLDSTVEAITQEGTEVTETIETETTELAEEPEIEMQILVLADSEGKTVADIYDFAMGYLSEADAEAAQGAMDAIGKAVGGEPHFVAFEEEESLAEALYNGTVDAVILAEGKAAEIAGTVNYSDFSKKTKEVLVSDLAGYLTVDAAYENNLDTFIVYFSGIDVWGGVDVKSRSDVNILAVVNTKTRHIQLVNTPRDYFVELPISAGAKDKLTHAGLYGVENSIGALENLYGVNVDYYVRMNFSGFEAIIDTLGGVDVYSECDFTVEPIKHYTEGINHLTGLEALAFVRERKSFASGDNQRGRNQMAMLTAMVEKVCSTDILYNYSEVLDSIAANFQTNMTSEEIYELVRMELASTTEWTIDTYSVTGSGGKSATYSTPNSSSYVMIPNDADVAEAKAKMEAVLNEQVQ